MKVRLTLVPTNDTGSAKIEGDVEFSQAERHFLMAAVTAAQLSASGRRTARESAREAMLTADEYMKAEADRRPS